MNCKRCGAQKTRKSRMRSGKWARSLLLQEPLRCGNCNHRFWVQYETTPKIIGLSIAGGLTIVMICVLLNSRSDSVQHTALSPQIEPQHLSTSNIPKNYDNAGTQVNKTTVSEIGNSRTEQIASDKSDDPIRSPQAIIQLYQKHAEEGDIDAQYKLGLSFLTGKGSLQDFAEAMKWLVVAAERGYGLAQYELGLIYRTGKGVAINYELSYAWLNLAAASGIKDAVPIRDKVMSSLDPQQLIQAQRLSREWITSRSKFPLSPAWSREPAGTGPWVRS
jgi:uncharacterized protein